MRLIDVQIARARDAEHPGLLYGAISGVVGGVGDAILMRIVDSLLAVPTLLLFDRAGRSAGAFYGAPPTLHAEAEGKIAPLVE